MSVENLFAAWKEFRCGKRRKPDVQQFEFALEDNVFQLHERLSAGKYRHGQYLPFSVNDPKPRRIHKATVRDRLVHHAIFRVLYPIFDDVFIYDSYSCRLDKGTHRAIRRLQSFLRQVSRNDSRDVFVVKCDVRKFFDSIDHVMLRSLTTRRVNCVRTVALLDEIIESFHKTAGVGLPLGNVTSQLFANIYLHELDRFVKHRLGVRHYLRYCDDFAVAFEKLEVIGDFVTEVGDFLKQRLNLSLHPDKIIIRRYRQGIDFLGYIVRPYCTTLRSKTRRRMLSRVTVANRTSYLGLLRHCAGKNIERLITEQVTCLT